MTVLNPTRRQRAAQWVLGSDALLVGADDYAKVRDERESVTTRLREEALFDQLATNVIEWHEAMVRFAARLSSGVALSTRETWARTEQECSLMLRIANVLSAAFSFSEAVERNGRHRKHGCGDSIKHAAYDESAMTETGYSLRIPGVKERIPISQEDYERARDTLALMEERLQEETLFDQLATNVIEWQQAMVRLAGRANGSTLDAWERTVRECDPVRRVANVLSAALSFLENVDKEEKHKKHQCGNAMCTIARELRNRLQHGRVQDTSPFKVLIDTHTRT